MSVNSYANVTNTNIETKNKDLKKESYNKYKKGWTIVRRNPITNKPEIVNPNESKETKERIERNKANRIHNNMINRWNKFRDEDIELRGDLSVYFNYKEEINRLVKEEEMIQELMYEKQRYDSDDPDYSDDENNKHLIY